ncbi:MAG: HutD family protein [Burkholderiaceae bacterium]
MNVARRIRQVHADSVSPSAWRNGGGQTRELLTRPAEGEWQLRISLADITRDGPFSAFPGVQRWFGVIAGAGVALRFGQEVRKVTADSSAFEFDGAAAPECSLLDGPTRDLNLMVRKGQARMSRVQAGQAWDEPFDERGMFTTVAGTLRCNADEAIALPALTLVWDLGAEPCRFEPVSTGAAGWWLGWSALDGRRA